MSSGGALNFSADAVEQIAKRMLGEPNKKLSTRRELRWGRHGSLSVIPSRGVFNDYEAGIAGGMLDLLVHTGAAGSRAEAARILEADGDLVPREDFEDRRQREAEEAADRARRTNAAAAVWRAGLPIAGSIAETYLRGRAIRGPVHLGGLRFHPTAPVTPYRPASATCPAIAAAVVTGRGDLTGAHLTFLQADGSGKAAMISPRKMMGLVGGGHIRLIKGERLLVGEGIETTFSAWDAADLPDLGCAAVLSTSGMAGFQWPAHTTGLVIAYDRDENGAGERAARHLASRAHASSLAVDLLPPPEGHNDWNEQAQAERVR